jgi:hypothetical protein
MLLANWRFGELNNTFSNDDNASFIAVIMQNRPANLKHVQKITG